MTLRFVSTSQLAGEGNFGFEISEGGYRKRKENEKTPQESTLKQQFSDEG